MVLTVIINGIWYEFYSKKRLLCGNLSCFFFVLSIHLLVLFVEIPRRNEQQSYLFVFDISTIRFVELTAMALYQHACVNEPNDECYVYMLRLLLTLWQNTRCSHKHFLLC